MQTLNKKQWHVPTVLSVAMMSSAQAKTFNPVETTVDVGGGNLVPSGPAS